MIWFPSLLLLLYTVGVGLSVGMKTVGLYDAGLRVGNLVGVAVVGLRVGLLDAVPGLMVGCFFDRQ